MKVTFRLQKNHRGFALIATISVLSLILLVALAMVNLSTLETKKSSQNNHQLIAQANARVAVKLAIARLQSSMGPDQNINALSQIFGDPSKPTSLPAHSHLTGVWGARNDTLGSTPDYSRDALFKGWLVSSDDPVELESIDFVNTGSFSDPVEIVGKYTAGSSNATDYVTAGKIKIDQGKLAWWVGDENSKALSFPRNVKEEAGTMTLADRLAGFATPGTSGIQSLSGLEAIGTNTTDVDKVITNGQLAYYVNDEVAGANSRPYFHDLTTFSQSVLCDVSKGGLKKDLNLYLERQDIGWLADGVASWPKGPNGKIALSPPSEYDVLGWKQLHHYYHSQRMVTYVGDRPQLLHPDSDHGVGVNSITNPRWKSGVTKPTLVPVRVQFFLSFDTVETTPATAATATDPAKPAKYDLRFRMYPVMTLWNPYNVDLKVNGYKLLCNTLPLRNSVSINGTQVKVNPNGVVVEGASEGPKDYFTWGSGLNNKLGVASILAIKDEVIFKAGESRVFSVDTWRTDPKGSHRWHCYHEMKPIAHDYSGVKAGSVWGRRSVIPADGRDGNAEVLVPILDIQGEATDKVEIGTLANNFAEGESSHLDQQSSFGWRAQDLYAGDGLWETYLWSSKVTWRHEANSPSPANFSSNNLPNDTFGDLENAPRPFCVIDARLKTPDEYTLANKPWVHTIPVHPFVGSTSEDHGADSHTSFYSHAYKIDYNQVDTFEQAGAYVQRVPGEDDHGFFGESYGPSGQTYITGKELPLVPLTSLAQLQNLPQHPIDGMNWSGHGMQNNAIANSFASPSITSNQIKESEFPYYVDRYVNDQGWLNGTKVGTSLFIKGTSHIDRSYAANQLLWDEYYFSSMAAQDGSFYQKNGSIRNLYQVVNEFYGAKQEALPNARYQPYSAGKSVADIVSSIVAADGKATVDGYKKSAAHLMVSGGFNINSTSEVAWANMLASAHLKRPVVMEATSSDKPSLEAAGKFIVSRYTMPNAKMSTVAAKDTKWRSYRELTSTEINQLAKAIVVQVKTRGPFRSLGEFVNRKLGASSDETSLYGALQAALEDPSVDINKEFRSNLIKAADISDANYKFTEAALGPRAQGAPAYVTQADLLQPIAPIITARSDTFVVRGYGESLDKNNNVMARAWCEVVVQRYPDYVDTADSPEVEVSALTSDTNKKYGRRFRIMSFRWLTHDEV